ncbi:lysophospholipid acyltransferase family protein [Rhodoferax mekongensis]|uniref:lysophospholipid acyltransferase family protein n=1 Tax=Rhodoferax mekongensis TaxID=3068341 RepID=UPI0028BDB031|nr:lipid A biosynthesis acyltransferase [Rhodoferax sp. TBRC 17199]MDT7516544.1 lipid A biosynthesis acyltransferase [Rhodoferax sp. TBRC 17199]
MSRWILRCIEVLGRLPLPLLRGLGVVLGWALYLLVRSRRRVVDINLTICFPEWTPSFRRRQSIRTFVAFAQAWLDRGWLWHASPEVLRERLRLCGALEELVGDAPTVLFAPHFVGLDAGWTALTQQGKRSFTTIYTDQANKVADAWILAGRKRFGGRLFGRIEGVKPIIAGLKAGEPLYLLPDMNFGSEESLFVPFFGRPAATVPSLSRFARLSRAKVVPILCRLTSNGYEIEVLPAWMDFPSGDLEADTARMNRTLETYIKQMPEQYYWVHKRFKDQPAGMTPPY